MSRTRWARKAPDSTWKQGDTSPALVYDLKDGTGAAVNLTGAAIKFMAWFPGATTAEINAAATIVGVATAGRVSYTPIAADTDTVGDLIAEFQVTFAGGAIESFPNGDWLKVRILDDIAA